MGKKRKLVKLEKGSPVWKALSSQECMTTVEFAHYAAGCQCKDRNDASSLAVPVKQIYQTIKDYIVSSPQGDYPESLCGYEPVRDEDGDFLAETFPKEAFQKFCEIKGIDYPFDKQVEGGRDIKGPDLTSNWNIITFEKIKQLMEENKALGDALASAIWLHDHPSQYEHRDDLKKDLDPKAIAHNWGAMSKGGVSRKQVDAIVDIFIRSGTKRRGKNFLPWKKKK